MRWLGLVLPLALLVGCGSGDALVKPTPLKPLTNPLQVGVLWDTGVAYAAPDRFAAIKPVLADQVIYVADPEGRVAAYSATNGKRLWRVDLKLKISGGLGYGGGMLVGGTITGVAFAINAKDGALLWRRQVSSEVLSPPAVASGLVLVHALDDHVLALDADDGTPRWIFKGETPPLTLHGSSAPVIAGERVMVGMADGSLVALGLFDGRLLWQTQIAEPQGRSELEHMVDIDSTPVVVDDQVYAIAYQGAVAALDIQTGRELWSRKFSAYRGFSAAGRNLFAVDAHGVVWALDRQSGATVWKQDKLADRAVTAPVVAGGYVVVGDYQGYLHWLSIDNGAFAARHQVDDAIAAPPLSHDDRVYAVGSGGVLEALTVGPH